MDAGLILGHEFDRENFDSDKYVKKIIAEKIYASDLVDIKEKLTRNAQQTSEEIKHSVYKNYTNFMETAKEVGHLEGKMSQLKQSLDEQMKLINMFKTMTTNTIASNETSSAKLKNGSESKKSSLAMLLEQVEGCGLITQKPGRNLLFHSDLEALHIEDYSVSHKLHAYLLSDAILLTLPQRKRNKALFNSSANSTDPSANRLMNNPLLSTSGKTVESNLSASNASANNNNTYQYKFQAFYELQDIKIMNIDDSKEVRNSFQLLKFPESLAFKCANAHLKKEWLESIENAKKQLDLQLNLENGANNANLRRGSYTQNVIHEEDEEEDDSKRTRPSQIDIGSLNMANISDYERSKILRELFADFDILLAQRDFEKAIEMLTKIKESTKQNSDTQLIYKQKENELISILRKDLITSKERGNNKGVIKTGKRVVNSLIKLKIYDEAIDLFIDYHKHLNAETLKKIKLEESNTIYMNNVLNLFFDNLRESFQSFREAFSSQINYCFSSYISWCDTEIEILIKKLQSQHYLGRHFDLTIENCELIFEKAKEFSRVNNFELTFLFETKLVPILEATIKEQYDILKDASVQRSKLELEDNTKLASNTSHSANFEQNRKLQAEKLLKYLNEKDILDVYFKSDDQLNVIKSSTSSALQFSYGAVRFFCDCLRVYYQDVSYCVVETFTKLFKFELKLYRDYLESKRHSPASGLPKRQDVLFNISLIERMFLIVEHLYFAKTGVHSKIFQRVIDKFSKSKDDIEVKV